MTNVKKIYKKQLDLMLIKSNADLEMVCKATNVRFLTKEEGWNFYA